MHTDLQTKETSAQGTLYSMNPLLGVLYLYQSSYNIYLTFPCLSAQVGPALFRCAYNLCWFFKLDAYSEIHLL